MSTLGVAILGLDHWYAALDLAERAARSDSARLVAVADPDQSRVDYAVGKYGAELATTDYRAVLERDDVQVVVAQASTDRNVEICRAAAAAGKHIISVKPMAMDRAGADAIVEAVQAAGVFFLPYETIYRLMPEIKRLKQWLGEGRIGQPLRYTQTLQSSLPQSWPGNSDSGWWLDPARVPGGGWLDHGIYAIDIARWLFGSDPATVQGVVGNRRHPDLPLEDYGLATFTLADGTVLSIEDTWTADRGFFFGRSEIVGSAGAILDDTRATGRIALRGDFGFEGWTSLESQRGGSHTLLEHMAECIAGTSEPIASVEDGRTNLLASLAFYEAARSGTTVRIG